MYYNGLYSLTIKVNYQTNLTKTITMRVERRKTKNRAVGRVGIFAAEKFATGTVHQCWLLFHCSLLLLFPLHYFISSCFDILHSRLVEIDRKPYEVDGNQPDFVMIGLTRRFGFQFLQKLQKQPRNAIKSIIGTRTCQLG